jgi:hypothetical protein
MSPEGKSLVFLKEYATPFKNYRTSSVSLFGAVA